MNISQLQGKHVFQAAAALAGGLLLVFLVKLFRIRRKMMGLPGPPYHPILGHLLVAIKMSQSLPPDVHPHHYWHWLRKEYDLGDFYYFDVWPMGPPTLIICNADVADHVTMKHSLDKHPMVREYLKQHLGTENMAAANGEVWRKARTIYNPGFAMPHLMSVISTIVEDVLVFHDVLGELADSAEKFDMEATAMKLSFDVIGRLVLDMGLNSQRSSDELVDAFRKQLQYLSSANTWSSPLAGINPIRQFSIARNSAVIDKYLGRVLDQRCTNTSNDTTSTKKKSMLDVALKTYNEEYRGMSSSKGPQTMDAAFRKLTIDQIRTFVFAGHDTISTSISMIFYFLSSNPVAHSKARAELDAVFGPSLAATAAAIRADPYILNRLPYNLAVMKEALRLFPPANTVRIGSPSVFITDPATGAKFPTHDWVVWPDSYVIGRHESYFPDPERFLPERWIPEQSPYPAPPAGAFRAFERGPRNCIGSEFGTLEIKVVMALTLREYAFVPGYAADALTVDGEPCYQMLFGSAKPKGSVPGTVVRSKAEPVELKA